LRTQRPEGFGKLVVTSFPGESQASANTSQMSGNDRDWRHHGAGKNQDRHRQRQAVEIIIDCSSQTGKRFSCL